MPQFKAQLGKFARYRDDFLANLDSEIPLIRTIGNLIFAQLLGALSQRPVADTASGMRVIRRSALGDLYPLPDGLHFTPAMSARAILSRMLWKLTPRDTLP